MSYRVFRFLLPLVAVSLALQAGAAQVASQARPGYQRLTLAFDSPATLKIDQHGNSITLHFTTAVSQPAAVFETALKGYATHASISANGHDVTITMNSHYRTRQFTSGSMVGVDFIGTPPDPSKVASMPPTEKNAKPVAPDDTILTTKKPLPEKPIADIVKPKEAPAPKPAPVIEAKVQAPAEPSPPILTTKKSPEPVQPVEPAPLTKPIEKLSAPKMAAAVPSKPTPEPVVEKSSGPFLVSVRTKEGASVIHFPYRSRTAAAVFERGHTIWIVFSQAENVNAERLRSILPHNVTDAIQYRYGDMTVLRLVTDGTLHATAQAVKGSYGWEVSLAPAPTLAAQDIPLAVDRVAAGSRLLLSAFDVADPLRFYDPEIGDLLLIVPSYETGHGMKYPRHFPQFELFATTQGIAVASQIDTLKAATSRLGVSIESPNGLSVSDNLEVLKTDAKPLQGVSSGVLMPYEQWYVAPDKFRDTLRTRLHDYTTATAATKPDVLYSLATLYLSQGLGTEALGYLDRLHNEAPDYYKAHKLAVLTTAAYMLNHRPLEAAAALDTPELADVKEAELWREYLALYIPKANAAQQIQQQAEKQATPAYSLADDEEMPSSDAKAVPAVTYTKPVLRFLKFNRSYIRFYPPRIRQMIAEDAANAYLANGLEEKALATYDTLNRDDILKPVSRRAEYVLALEAIKKKKPADAELIFARLNKQNDDPYIRAQSRFMQAMLAFQAGTKTPEETAEILEGIRTSWRGDHIERDILKALAQIYTDNKQYDEALRAYKNFVEEFPNDPDYLTISTEMSGLFEHLYVDGAADDMPPLKSLSLFYEFRDLTPIGDKGDLIIQKLADRLAQFDLIDRATQLLENQINFRISGEPRSRVGARLALLYLVNHQPEEALKVISVTNFGGNSPELQRQRLEISAQALNTLGKYEDALNTISTDRTATGDSLRLDIFWAAQDWPNVVNQAEDMLARRHDLTAPLTPEETQILLKLALGYSFQGDYTQLRYLKDYYGNLLSDTAYKQIFDFITNDTAPLDREDSVMLTQQISHTETFLNTFKAKIAAGKLSEAVK